jgi:hypothetical protein
MGLSSNFIVASAIEHAPEWRATDKPTWPHVHLSRASMCSI